jgi:regulator of replication initiation timing
VAVASESTEINAFHLQMNDLIRENERLRKENATLRQTLKNVTGLLS